MQEKKVAIPEMIVIYRTKCMIPDCQKMCFIVGTNVQRPPVKGALCSLQHEQKYKQILSKDWKHAQLQLKDKQIIIKADTEKKEDYSNGEIRKTA